MRTISVIRPCKSFSWRAVEGMKFKYSYRPMSKFYSLPMGDRLPYSSMANLQLMKVSTSPRNMLEKLLTSTR